jgi:triosephosphate isomerase
MRKQIAAANWKMNCTYKQGEKLLDDILNAKVQLAPVQQVIFAVPFPYLIMANSEVAEEYNYDVAAQNCYTRNRVLILASFRRNAAVSWHPLLYSRGHSERREYFSESNQQLAEKVNICLEHDIIPIFCCGEPLGIRESGTQNSYVEQQLQESLFHLKEVEVQRVIIAYEPIWAIGTGKTASSQQAQEMHAHLRSILSKQYGPLTAGSLSILYGGSVKAANAMELFSQPDVDGGLVGGASLVAEEFITIIRSLKK